ncbi:MAG TPA: Uma2 family endonuclease [Blastocatellia bacterium]|nr:Uma2 family endonuclease [Blastocatellia bacterium]
MEEMNLIIPPQPLPPPGEVAPGLDAWPPTGDELPYSDGVPRESHRHVQQMLLLVSTLQEYWAERQDFFVGGNMFLYFNVEQQRKNDFVGPDVFVVQDVPRRDRKSWVIWQEGKGPDVVIELLSESTAEYDRTEKKLIYQDRVRVPEYFYYDPYSGEFAGFLLQRGRYRPIQPDAHGQLVSEQLNLALRRWDGEYGGEFATWLRWATLNGQVIPTPAEAARAAQRQAEVAQQQAEAAQQRASELEAVLARYREQFGELPEATGSKTDRKKQPAGRKRKSRR